MNELTSLKKKIIYRANYRGDKRDGYSIEQIC